MNTENQKSSSETPSSQGGVIGISWEYFFGGSAKNGKVWDRYYKAFIDGVRVEKWASNNRPNRYCVGEFVDDVNTYLNEQELIEAAKRYKEKYASNQ